MTTATAGEKLNTVGELAARFGVPQWMVRRLYETGQLPPAARIGAYRVVPESEVGAVGRALAKAGYLKAAPVKVPA